MVGCSELLWMESNPGRDILPRAKFASLSNLNASPTSSLDHSSQPIKLSSRGPEGEGDKTFLLAFWIA